MLITDYNPETKIPLFSESDIDNYLVLCHTKYEDHGTLSIIRRTPDKTRVYMAGVSLNFNFHIRNKSIDLERWDMSYNQGAIRLIDLISNKWRQQNRYIHVVYVIKTKNDLDTIIEMFDLSGSRFLRELEKHPKFESTFMEGDKTDSH